MECSHMYSVHTLFGIRLYMHVIKVFHELLLQL